MRTVKKVGQKSEKKNGKKGGKDTLAGLEVHFLGRQQLVMTAREGENNLPAKFLTFSDVRSEFAKNSTFSLSCYFPKTIP